MPTNDPTMYTPNWNDPTATRWFDDPDEVVDFARWYFEGSHTHHSEVIGLFDKPWKWQEEYTGFVKDTV